MQFYNKFGANGVAGKPAHSPSQIKNIAHKFAGRPSDLNKALAKKYQKSLADLSDSDHGGDTSDDDALI